MLASVASGIPDTVPFDVLVDGDNALVFLAGADVDRVYPHFHRRVLNQCGQELTLESPVSVLEKVRFGQSAPVNLGHGLGWTMCREWNKVLSGFASSHVWLNEPRFARRWLYDVCRCELSLARGLPVVQEAFLGMLRHIGRDGKKVHEGALSDYFVVGAWLAGEEDAVPVSLDARLSYERAFGLSVLDQRLMEEGFRPGFGLTEVETPFPAYSSALEAEPGLLESSWDVRY
jgi:hypothetical protein